MAQSAPGTPLEVSARLMACEAILAQSTIDTVRLGEQTDRIIAGFPGTASWLAARILKITYIETAGNTSEQWERFEQLIAEVGGRPCNRSSMATDPGPATVGLGSHTVQLVAADLEKNVVQTRWEFSVAAQPLTLALQVLSKHVNPGKGEVAKIAVECSRYPVNLQFTVKRGSSTVYQALASSQANAFEFIWDGRTTSGQPASNGNHSIEIEATDGSGARALESANVQVNNNQ